MLKYKAYTNTPLSWKQVHEFEKPPYGREQIGFYLESWLWHSFHIWRRQVT